MPDFRPVSGGCCSMSGPLAIDSGASKREFSTANLSLRLLNVKYKAKTAKSLLRPIFLLRLSGLCLNPMEPSFTTGEAAKCLQVSNQTIRNLHASGFLKADRTLGGHLRIAPPEVELLKRM